MSACADIPLVGASNDILTPSKTSTIMAYEESFSCVTWGILCCLAVSAACLFDRWRRLSSREKMAMRIVVEHRLKKVKKAAVAALSPASSFHHHIRRHRSHLSGCAQRHHRVPHPAGGESQEEHTATSLDSCSRIQQTGNHEFECSEH